MVEQSRRACSAVANGEADCAIIGGDVPDELAHVLKVGTPTKSPADSHVSSFAIVAGKGIMNG